jgi:SpoU rRNA methylase family enzyme
MHEKQNEMPTLHNETLKEHKNKMLIEDLKDRVVSLLVSDYDFLMEEAEEAVKDSQFNSPDMWDVNATPEDLAKYLASDESDE